ncbi:MAG: alpha/beta hydrolase [Solirubrobacterales bacterium]
MDEKILWLPGGSKARLAAIEYLPSDRHDFSVIACHGFRGAKENTGRLAVFARKVNAIGGAVIGFDFTGCGQSEGDFESITLSRQVADLKAVIAWVRERHPTRIVLLGRSFGGTTALAAGSETADLAGLVLWSAPVDLPGCFAPILRLFDHESGKDEAVSVPDGAGIYRIRPGFAADFPNHDFARYGRRISSPVLIVQGLADDTVDPENARKIADLVSGPAELHLVPEADHRFERHKDEREAVTLNWLRKTMLLEGA